MSREIFEIIIDEDITPPIEDEPMGSHPYSRVSVKFKNGGKGYVGKIYIDKIFLSREEKLNAAMIALGSALFEQDKLEK